MPDTPEQAVADVKGSTKDGPRYVVSVQTIKDPCCHKDVYETEKLHEAQDRAKSELQKVGRRVLLYDRKICSIIERFEVATAEETPKKKQKPAKRK